MGAERRSSPRYRFVADAEVVERESDSKMRARTSDLSIGGCFLDMLNPSPKGTQIQVRILYEGAVFTAFGRVAFVIPNIGMGVAFTKVDGDQVNVLHEWLSDLTRTNS